MCICSHEEDEAILLLLKDLETLRPHSYLERNERLAKNWFLFFKFKQKMSLSLSSGIGTYQDISTDKQLITFTWPMADKKM